MVIDAHTHIFPPEFIRDRDQLTRDCRWFGLLYANPKRRMMTAEELLASMDRAGVNKTVVFGFPWSDGGRLRYANDYVFDMAEEAEGRLIPFAVVDPGNMYLTEEEVVRLRGRNIGGIGELMPDGQGFHLDDQDTMDGVMRLAAFHKLIVMTHTSEPVGHDYPGKGSVTPQMICRLAERFPEVNIICGHWGGGLLFYELMSEVAATLRNVYYDSAASTLLYDDRIFRIAARIAPKKILFGTDCPIISQASILERVRRELADTPYLDDFLSGNALRLFESTHAGRLDT
jgi:predicted TIM-barrel fold metal-dependent hydrolase